MSDIRTKLADLICHADRVLCPKRWLSEEASDLATSIPHLDDIPSQAILPLAKLVAGGESDARRLALTLDIEDETLDVYLNALCNFEFTERTGSSYKATSSGEQAFYAVGQRMVARELFQVRARLQQLEQLHKNLNGY